MSDALRQRIEADIADETHRAELLAFAREQQALKRSAHTVSEGYESDETPSNARFATEANVSSLTETPDPEGEGSDGMDWWHAAQSDYESVCENQTGVIVPDEVFEAGRLRRLAQDETSVELAKALDSTGRFTESPYYKGEFDPNRCTVVGVFTGVPLPLPPVKRSNMLPSVQKAARSKMLRNIEHFLSTLPGSGRKAAMFTITNGPRVAIMRESLRDDIGKFHRWLSKMAATKAFKQWGVQMQWRATEFGEPKWVRDDSSGMDQLTLHLHAHCLVTLPERLTERRRKKMRKKLWRVFGVIWDDAGDVQNPREFVKYPVKDGDLRTIVREGGPGVFADFAQAVRGMHIVQPMGVLKERWATWKANARRATAFSRLDGRTLEETGDWNAGKRPLAGPNANRKEYRKRSQTLAARLAASVQTVVSHSQTVVQTLLEGVCPGEATPVATVGNGGETGDDGDGSSDPDRPTGEPTPPPKNRVIALLAPAPYGSPICEPGVVVWGFDGNLAAVLNQPRVAAIIARHRRAFEHAQEARALIRACAHDAGACAPRAASKGSQRSNNCPRALGDLALLDAENDPPPPDPVPLLAEIEEFSP